MTRMLDKIVRRSDAIDKESLCILAGQRVCSSVLLLDILTKMRPARFGTSALQSIVSPTRETCLTVPVSPASWPSNTFVDQKSRSSETTSSWFVDPPLSSSVLNTHPATLACPRRAGPCTTRYSPHSILCHVCVFPRSGDASCLGSIVAGAEAERWNDECRAQCTARDMCFAQSGWCANATRRDIAAA